MERTDYWLYLFFFPVVQVKAGQEKVTCSRYSALLFTSREHNLAHHCLYGVCLVRCKFEDDVQGITPLPSEAAVRY